MAESLPSPPTSRASSPDESSENVAKNELLRHLDDLLEQYLERLDEYARLREELSKTLSDGFLSLAHAQRTSNMGPGRRYGQEGYDGRMKALKRVCLRERNLAKNAETSITGSKTRPPDESLGTDSVEMTADVCSYVNEQAIRSGNFHEGDSLKRNENLDESLQDNPKKSTEDLVSGADNQTQKQPKPDPAYRDPVSWYGILVPSTLRQAQKHFSTSLESTMPNLVSVMSSLRHLEAQIWLTRSKLEIRSQYQDQQEPELAFRIATADSFLPQT